VRDSRTKTKTPPVGGLSGLDRWQEVFDTLSRNKLRTFLTALGVFWGVFMLVIMLGFGRGLETGVTGNLGPWAKNIMAVWPKPTTIPHAGHTRGRVVRLTMDDVDVLERQVPGILAIAPRLKPDSSTNTVVSRGVYTEPFEVGGDVQASILLSPLDITAGRFLNDRDVDNRRKVAVIGANVRETLFQSREDPIGAEIRIGSIPFTVIGTYESKDEGERADRANSRVLIPISTLAHMMGWGNRIRYMALLLDKDYSSAETEKQVKAVLKRHHKVRSDDPGGFGSFNRAKMFQRFTVLFSGIATLSWIVGILTLLAGAMGVSNILMISINERTKEIGIRKALGATPRSVLAQIIQEAVVLTGLAGMLGLVAGVGTLALSTSLVESSSSSDGVQFFAAPNLDLTIALLATLILTVVGGLAGLAPARAALAINPVEALAHE